MTKKIAYFLSRGFEPMIILSVLAALAGYHAGLVGSTYILYLTVVLAVMILPPSLYRLRLLTTRQTDWDVTDRTKRIKPLSLQIAFLVLYIFLISLFHAPELTRTFITMLVWLTGFLAVTTQWKISGHTATLALATGFALHWFGWVYWPLLLLVPLVGIARVVRRDHTTAQVVVGAMYSWALLYIVIAAALV